MPSVTTFFRHCPSCGRRFEIRLVSKDLVSTEREDYPTTRVGTSSWTHAAARAGLGNVRSTSQTIWDSHVELEEKVRVTVERKGFQYAFRCKHCGHQWIEKRSEETQPRIEKRQG